MIGRLIDWIFEIYRTQGWVAALVTLVVLVVLVVGVSLITGIELGTIVDWLKATAAAVAG